MTHSRARKGTPPAHSRSPDVKRQAIFLARWAGRGAFKATALVLAFVIIVALWLWNASLLTTAADQNLRIIKMLTQLLHHDSVVDCVPTCVGPDNPPRYEPTTYGAFTQRLLNLNFAHRRTEGSGEFA